VITKCRIESCADGGTYEHKNHSDDGKYDKPWISFHFNYGPLISLKNDPQSFSNSNSHYQDFFTDFANNSLQAGGFALRGGGPSAMDGSLLGERMDARPPTEWGERIWPFPVGKVKMRSSFWDEK